MTLEGLSASLSLISLLVVSVTLCGRFESDFQAVAGCAHGWGEGAYTGWRPLAPPIYQRPLDTSSTIPHPTLLERELKEVVITINGTK